MNFKEGLPAERLQQVAALREVLTSRGHTLAQAALAYIWALDERPRFQDCPAGGGELWRFAARTVKRGTTATNR